MRLEEGLNLGVHTLPLKEFARVSANENTVRRVLVSVLAKDSEEVKRRRIFKGSSGKKNWEIFTTNLKILPRELKKM